MLPDWQVVEFEEKAFWATARSRLEILPVPDEPQVWELDVENSVVDNSEQITVHFDATSGRVITRSRLSRGKEQRVKSYQYESGFVVRERRNPGADATATPDQWRVTNTKNLSYPAAADNAPMPVVTSPYLLVLLAQRLQAQGPDKSMEVLVLTDLNFYRVRLTSGNGIPVQADYLVTGQDRVSGKRETLAVALHTSPEGELQEDNDFDLLGLQGDVIILFDRASGLPLQVRGEAPRIGATEINLKSVTMRDTPQ
jgi:hypothetical protein